MDREFIERFQNHQQDVAQARYDTERSVLYLEDHHLEEWIHTTVLEFMGEHVYQDGLPEELRGPLYECIERAIEREGNLSKARKAFTALAHRLRTLEDAMECDVAAAEREEWLARIA